MIQKEELPLTREDIQQLRKQILPILLFPVAFIIIVALMFNTVLGDMEDVVFDGVFIYIIIAFGVFFLGVIGYMAWSFTTDINRGIKYKVTGIVTNKRLDINSHKRGSARHGAQTRTTRNYYVYLDDEEFKMDFADYNRVKVGDKVVMEKAPKSMLTFSINTIETRDEVEVLEEELVDEEYISAEIQEVQFSEQDSAALNRKYQADLKRKLFWMAPFVFIIVSFAANGYSSLLVFLFPLVIIPIVQLAKLMKRVNTYGKDKAHGHKIGITAVIEDKLTITSNRTRGKNMIKTTWRSISVDPVLYDKLNTGDKIIFFKPKYDDKPLSLMGLDKQEHYLV